MYVILNNRKIQILEAIINDYIQTGEPIGSRTIAKKYDLGISSATIRNEMSDLEELGLIEQPHTSAGRVPSDKGYRLYVDRLMNYRELTNEETRFLQDIITSNIDHIDYLMQQTAKALVRLTNYTAVVTEPKSVKMYVKHVQLVPLDEHSVIAVVVTDTKLIKNNIIKTVSSPSYSKLNAISERINAAYDKYSIDTISQIAKNNMFSTFGDDEEFIRNIFLSMYETLKTEENVNYYTSGVNNILDFPEFSDIEKAKDIFRTLEEKDMIISLLGKEYESDKPVQILIGGENSIEQLKNCSIIKTKYQLGNAEGTLGIIGPTRMNYSQTVSILNGIVKNINEVIKALSGSGGIN